MNVMFHIKNIIDPNKYTPQRNTVLRILKINSILSFNLKSKLSQMDKYLARFVQEVTRGLGSLTHILLIIYQFCMSGPPKGFTLKGLGICPT